MIQQLNSRCRPSVCNAPYSGLGWKQHFQSALVKRSASSARIFLLLMLFAAATTRSIWARGLPVQESILNFGKVSERLYRGAQPDANGIKSLKKLGVKLIVNLRMPGDGWKDEAVEATANGIL